MEGVCNLSSKPTIEICQGDTDPVRKENIYISCVLCDSDTLQSLAVIAHLDPVSNQLLFHLELLAANFPFGLAQSD